MRYGYDYDTVRPRTETVLYGCCKVGSVAVLARTLSSLVTFLVSHAMRHVSDHVDPNLFPLAPPQSYHLRSTN